MSAGFLNRIFAFIFSKLMRITTKGQEYLSPTQPVETDKAPGVKVKLLSIEGAKEKLCFNFHKGG